MPKDVFSQADTNITWDAPAVSKMPFELQTSGSEHQKSSNHNKWASPILACKILQVLEANQGRGCDSQRMRMKNEPSTSTHSTSSPHSITRTEPPPMFNFASSSPSTKTLADFLGSPTADQLKRLVFFWWYRCSYSHITI